MTVRTSSTNASFTGASATSHLTPMWQLAARNNQKPKIVTRRKSAPNAYHRVLWG